MDNMKIDPPSFNESVTGSHGQDSLPAYTGSAARPQTEHRYMLGKSSKPWLTLVLPSKAAKADDLPYFFGHAPITGRVELDLAKREYFVGLEVQVQGGMNNSTTYGKRVMSEAVDLDVKFVDVSQTIWQSNSTQSPSFTDRLRGREGETLEGRRTFEFSIELPHFFQSNIEPGSSGVQYALPSTFVETAARASVHYKMILVVKRGSMSTNERIALNFVWQPAVQPPAMSAARKLAYANGSADVPDLLQDPDGWLTIDPVRIAGKVFGKRDVGVEYTLSLSKPLSYTRGSIIPLSILVECEDEQALDLLSKPSSVSVKLLCNIHYNTEAKMETKYAKVAKTPVQLSLYSEFRVAQTAVWWKPKASDEKLKPGTARLMGEIHVEPRLKPGFKLPDVKLFYTVTLVAPVVTGFEVSPDIMKDKNLKWLPLKSQEVEIATVYGEDGVRPIAVTPPQYDKGEPWPNSGALNSSFA